MTFDAKINLHAGFPGRYLLVFALVAGVAPLYLAFRSLQSELDWVWTGLLFVISLFTVFVIYREQRKQHRYTLLIDGATPLVLRARPSGKENDETVAIKVAGSDFILQTRNIVFAKLQLDKGFTIHLVFHALNNPPEAFRRFKVRLKMSGLYED